MLLTCEDVFSCFFPRGQETERGDRRIHGAGQPEPGSQLGFERGNVIFCKTRKQISFLGHTFPFHGHI